MPKTCCSLVIGLLLSQLLCAQFYKVSGNITTNTLEPLAFAGIEVKELKTAVLSRSDGSYELQLEMGSMTWW